ncbi:hypothetical protein [Aureivirga sp. CE67]|uniref:hypothetical protein n=1 Tax=Aureivirga sp. CE67 TaxID=1788983 RepID=UPI0018CA3627|nr:hypothetical protein [Aureivirga sp. CE67]
MKTFIILISLFISFSAKAQVEQKINSIHIRSRVKADNLIHKIDSTKNLKLLFSLIDEEYYIVIKRNNNYTEYYIETDSLGNIKRKILLDTTEKDKNMLSKAFQLNQYSTDFITKVPNAKLVAGRSSYFVIKDKKGKRYGEFSISSMVMPPVIDPDLLIYLNYRLIEYSK